MSAQERDRRMFCPRTLLAPTHEIGSLQKFGQLRLAQANGVGLLHERRRLLAQLFLCFEQLLHRRVVLAELVQDRGQFVAQAPIFRSGKFGEMLLQTRASVIELAETTFEMRGEPDCFDIVRRAGHGTTGGLLRRGEMVRPILNFPQHREQLGIFRSQFERALEPGGGCVKARDPKKFLGGQMTRAHRWVVRERLFVAVQRWIELIRRPTAFRQFVPEFRIVFLQAGSFAEMPDRPG